MTKWENLLYGCKYCNTRKSQKIKTGDADKWVWPDKDNTFLAYTYYGGAPKVNETYLKELGLEVFEKAQALYEGVGLGFCPLKIGDKDKRWIKRMETLGVAEDSKKTWIKMKTSEFKNALIRSFPGTASECFDKNGDAIKRKDGLI